MSSLDKFENASDRLQHVDGTTSAIRDQVRMALDKLDVEQASDTLYNYVADQKSRLVAVRSQLLYTSIVEQFFNANGGDKHLSNSKSLSTPNGLQFIECVKKLTNYAVTLLRPLNMRPETWDTIMTSNVVFSEIISPFKENKLILHEIGYKQMGETFVHKKSTAVPLAKIRELSSDLLVFRAYMEVKLDVVKAPDNFFAVPMRSEVKRAPAIKPDTPQLCDMCSQPAKFMCLEDIKACRGKAWCPPCNNKWHINNETRKGHKLQQLTSYKPLIPASPKLPDKPPSRQQSVQANRQSPRKPSTSPDPAQSPNSPAQRAPHSPVHIVDPLSSIPSQKAPSPPSGVVPYQRGSASPSSGGAPYQRQSAPYQNSSATSNQSPSSVPNTHNMPQPVHVGYGDPHLPPLPHSKFLVSPDVPPPQASPPQGYVVYYAPYPQGYDPRYVNPAPVPAQRPTPAPRRSIRNSVNSVNNSEGQPMNSNQSTGSQPQDASKTLFDQLQSIVDQALSDGSIEVIKDRLEKFNKSMAGIKVQISKEPSGSTKKAALSRELMQIRKQNTRLENRLEELLASDVSKAHLITYANPAPVIPTNHEEENDSFALDNNFGTNVEVVSPKQDQGPSPLTYLKFIAAAENSGYSMDEILIGLKQVPFRDIADWLDNSYPTIQTAVQMAAEQQPNNPKFCQAEIKKAVISHGLHSPADITNLNTEAMVETCVRERRENVILYCELFNDPGPAKHDGCFKMSHIITGKIVNDIIYECNGDSDEILWDLNEKVADVIRKHIWDPVQPDELIDVDGMQIMKKAIDILQDETVDMSIKLMLAHAELGLSQTQIDELLYIMRKIHGKDDREFELEDAIVAVKAVAKTTRFHINAMAYLSNPCSSCLGQFPKHKMANLFCHDTTVAEMGLCIDCAKHAFASAIKTEPVAQFVCPARCGAPAVHITVDTQEAYPFFEKLLSIVFPNIGLERELVDKFEKKVAIWRMSADKSFFWCTNTACSEDGFGFLDEGAQLCLTCPECRNSRCRNCEKKWTVEHENRTCEEFTQWESENTDEFREGEQLRNCLVGEQGIQCPKCRQRFHLARGGCMDCVCPTCRYQFCSGCGEHITKRCPRNDDLDCNKKGLHGHHPRNCHFYLRDFDIEQLQQLLRDNSVAFNSGKTGGECKQTVESDEGKIEDCNEKEFEAGQCVKHYKEYMSLQINSNKLEVLPMLNIGELERVLTRDGYELPVVDKEISEQDYRDVLTEDIYVKKPLRDLSAFRNF